MRTGYRSGARLLFGIAALLGLYLAVPDLADHARAVYTADVARSGPRFTRTNAGLPVVWRTCDSIPVLVNPGRHGMEAYTEIVSTMTDIGNTVGMRFSFSLSAAVPRGNWGVSGGGQIPPVLVGWVDAAETDLLAGSDVAGSTVANPGMVNGTKNIRTGAIALNSGIYEDYSSGEGGGRTRVNLITHEVGHLLGLDHSSEGIMRAAVDEKAVAGFTQTEITFLRDNMPACGRDMPTP